MVHNGLDVPGNARSLYFQVDVINIEFVQLIKDPTHKTNIHDIFLINRPDLFDVQVIQSKTKHKVVLVNCDKTTSNGDKTVKPSTTIDVRVYSPVVGNLLCQSLCNYNWIAIVNAIDAQSDTINAIYDDFVKIVKWHVGQIVPLRKVIMRESEPSYVTPQIKLLLRKRNKLHRV